MFSDLRIIDLGFKLVYDNEEQQEQQEQQEQPQEQQEQPQEENKEVNKTKTFTQEEVNRIMAEEKRKEKKNRDQLINELKGLRDNVTMTQGQREQLESRIEQLQNETLTAQELARKDREKLVKTYDGQLKHKDEQINLWRNTYAEEKTIRELTDAAIDHKAISPSQIVNFLKPSTKLVEELKDGKPTGKWVSRVTFLDKDEKGDLIPLELSVTEAVKRMSEMTEHWNLFNSGANSGLGQFNNAGSNGYQGGKPPKDHAQYLKWREANMGKKR